MADFIIYNKTHWSKDVSEAIKSVRTFREELKFDAVDEIGDIVEVRKDGKANKDSFARIGFRVVSRPDLDYKKYRVLSEAVRHTFKSSDDKFYLKYRRRGKIDEFGNIIDKLGILDGR